VCVCVREGVTGSSQQPVAANETVSTSTGDYQLLILDAESIDIPCAAEADGSCVSTANDVITVLHKFHLVILLIL